MSDIVNVSPLGANVATFLATPSSANLAAALTDETGTAGAAVFSASPALTGSPTAPTQTATDNSTKIATTSFVTTAVNNAIAGVNPAVAVQAATAAILQDTPTYNNGVGGIGAFITSGATNTTLIVDGYTPSVGDRLLIKTQGSAFQNGVYTMTTLGALAVAWVITRALDYDQPSDMNNTGAIPVVNGTVNAQTSWVQTSTVTTVGTDAVTFTQFSLNPTTLVVGPASATDGVPALFSGTSGKLIKNSTPTGTGNPVMATSPTLTTPTFTAPTLGTPASGTGTNLTGIPIATGISGLGANVAAWAAAPSTSNLNAALTGGQVPIVLGSSGIAAPASPSSSTSEVNLVNVTVPAGLMGLNGQVEVYVLYKKVGTAGAATVNGRFSASSGDISTGFQFYSSANPATVVSATFKKTIANTNSASTQIAGNLVASDGGNGVAAVITGAINTANTSFICLNALVANASDTIQIVFYRVVFYPGV